MQSEILVNRGIWRLTEGRPADAERCLADAVAQVPRHLEALRQLALVRANHLRDRDGAVAALAAPLPPGDPRADEVHASLRALGADA